MRVIAGHTADLGQRGTPPPPTPTPPPLGILILPSAVSTSGVVWAMLHPRKVEAVLRDLVSNWENRAVGSF